MSGQYEFNPDDVTTQQWMWFARGKYTEALGKMKIQKFEMCDIIDDYDAAITASRNYIGWLEAHISDLEEELTYHRNLVSGASINDDEYHPDWYWIY